MMSVRAALGTIGLITALLLAGCGGDNNSGTDNRIEGKTAATTNEGNTTGSTGGSSTGAGSGTTGGSGTGDGTGSDATTTSADDQTATAELVIAIANHPSEAKYQQGVMSAPVGQEFVINYNNPSQQQHNWVLVQPGKEQAVADAAAAKGGDASGIEGVIAWSEPIAGKSTNIKVPPLQQGGYPYICTLPGHYAAGHKGALNVT